MKMVKADKRKKTVEEWLILFLFCLSVLTMLVVAQYSFASGEVSDRSNQPIVQKEEGHFNDSRLTLDYDGNK